jgi:hypothetical protein
MLEIGNMCKLDSKGEKLVLGTDTKNEGRSEGRKKEAKEVSNENKQQNKFKEEKSQNKL